MKTLVVEDDEDMQRLFAKVLRSRGHDVTLCGDAESAWAAYRRISHSLVLLDWQLPGMDGVTLCRLIRAHPGGDRSVIVMITGRDQPGDLHTVLKAGVNDYLAKPLGLDLLKVRLTIAEELVRTKQPKPASEAVDRQPSSLGDAPPLPDLVGTSGPINLVYRQIRDVAKATATVLIDGETGTGKELVARAIHACSPRSSHPFLAVNCAGLTDSILNSQLFGHRKGAFTGAIDHHQGFFEAAEGGTLFLDEIGDIPASVQTSLLRVLQEREITRLGESKPRKVNVRILVATHHNLGQDVISGKFRADLFYRIRVARIHLPPLRDRRDDIPLLVASFLSQEGAAAGKPVQDVSNEALQLLTQYAWPGNVRELKSTVEFALIHCTGAVIQAGDLPPEIRTGTMVPVCPSPTGGTPGDDKERLLAALERAGGNRTKAARLLGMSRATFYRRLSELDPNSGT